MTSDQAPATVPFVVDHLFRHQAGQVVATLTRIFGTRYLDLAEDVVQETLVQALRQWPTRGIPDAPGGWLLVVARRHAIDALRRERALRARQDELIPALESALVETHLDIDAQDHQLWDDQLRMLFTCCSPQLSRDAQVALTLKALGGFSVGEIARAFLAQEATIAQRLVRAKRTLRSHKVDFFALTPDDVAARLESVLDVVYVLFNEGYSAHVGANLVRHELVAEAVRLTTLLARHPVEAAPRVHALLALMLLQSARLPARTDDAGDLILLEDQDRARWDGRMIAVGLQELALSAQGDTLSRYHLEAEIAACHAVAPDYAATDWRRILACYDALVALTGSPVVALNRTVALARLHGPARGVAALEEARADPAIASYYLLHATLGDLWRQLGEWSQAAHCYEQALRLATTAPEQRFLTRRIALCVAEQAEATPASGRLD